MDSFVEIADNRHQTRPIQGISNFVSKDVSNRSQ